VLDPPQPARSVIKVAAHATPRIVLGIFTMRAISNAERWNRHSKSERSTGLLGNAQESAERGGFLRRDGARKTLNLHSSRALTVHLVLACHKRQPPPNALHAFVAGPTSGALAMSNNFQVPAALLQQNSSIAIWSDPMKRSPRRIYALLAGLALIGTIQAAGASVEDDRHTVAALDTEYQAAVKRNDAGTMARILDERFVLVVGSGKSYTRAELLDSARKGAVMYEQQDEEAGTQVVRMFGDTAIVTALLWIKGTSEGKTFERRLWFSDTYVRTPSGWRYVFGQASLALPAKS
jgi:ketosteroid isomerase-like protein